MDSDALLHPRGPLPRGVYWRRRGVTLAAVAIVLLLLSRACGSDGEPAARLSPTSSPSPSSGPTPSRTASPKPPASPSRSASPTPSPTTSPTTSAPLGPCKAADLLLSAKADAQSYPAGRRPVLTIGIANQGKVPCTRDIGQAAREIRVTSGTDRVWSSDDCSPGGGSEVVTLAPGAAPRTFSVTWSRKRSLPGCKTGTKEAAAGTYRVTGRFGDLTSPGDTFTLG
jgi:hypothetical protein